MNQTSAERQPPPPPAEVHPSRLAIRISAGHVREAPFGTVEIPLDVLAKGTVVYYPEEPVSPHAG